MRPTPPAGRFGRAGQKRVVDLAQRSTGVVKTLFDDCRLGRTIDTADILSTVDDIADVLIHDLSAFIGVTRLKSKDDYTYMHSVAVCALMISLAQEMGEPAKTVCELGMAGLLHDVGKVAIPDDILHKSDPLRPPKWPRYGVIRRTATICCRRHPMCRPSHSTSPCIIISARTARDIHSG